MTEVSTVQITLDFYDPDLDDEELETKTQSLVRQLREVDGIEQVNRVVDPNPPKGNKSMGAALAGLLTAEVSVQNIQNLFGFLGDRLANKPIELEVEANGKKLKVKAFSQQELTTAMKAAEDFIRA